ncbi:hypothetical protein H2199_006464 [Coniosporium tulheliwenetii]|uniref:Uncharacterized protein n=1 Tax=Coniosporium tulheliwenetii TaxID=3383036 RepID=A0ACC2YWH7_9PEZI|nr:hypothetical protein H2199_006464 [Cladosporium sp. JES 115]
MDLASTLSMDEIPTKLRCAICNKLAINAFRLPCCDQSICETCQSSLPDSCPVCAHTPLAAEDCKPNKALRLTVKAFLKSEEKKRAVKPATPATPSAAETPTPAIVDPPTSAPGHPPQTEQSGELSTPVVASIEEHAPAGEVFAGQTQLARREAASQPAAQDQTQEPEETKREVSVAQGATEAETADRQHTDPVIETQGAQDGVQSQRPDGSQDQNNMWAMNGGQGQQQMYGEGYGFDSSQAGYGDMGWNNASGFNPMMQMPMQNGTGGSWNNFSGMMGMPGMAMDPMSMQQGMFGGYGGQGMGMNGMNGMSMGMGYAGFGGGWNGQQMSGGDFGGAHAGYYPGGGYNQQSHQQGHFPPHQMHHQQFQKNNYQNQNRIQGQGAYHQRGYNRGYQGNVGPGQGHAHGQAQLEDRAPSRDPPQISGPDTQAQEPPSEDDPFFHQLPAELRNRRPSQAKSIDPASGDVPDTQEGKKSRPADTSEQAISAGTEKDVTAEGKLEGEVKSDTNAAPAEQGNATDNEPQNPDRGGQQVASESEQPGQEMPSQENTFMDQGLQQIQPIESIEYNDGPGMMMDPSGISMDPTGMHMNHHSPAMYGAPGPMMNQQYPSQGMMHDFPARGRGRGGRRGGYGRGGFQHQYQDEFQGGFGGRGVKGAGFTANGTFGTEASMPVASARAAEFTVVTPQEPKGVGVEGAPTGPKAMREGHPNAGFRGRGGFLGTPGRGGIAASVTSEPSRVRSVNAHVQELDPVLARARAQDLARHLATTVASIVSDHPAYPPNPIHGNDDVNGATIGRLANTRTKTTSPPPKNQTNQETPTAATVLATNPSNPLAIAAAKIKIDTAPRARTETAAASTAAEDTANGTDIPSESSSRRKSRSEKHRDRDRERDKERDRERDKDRKTDYEREKERPREREKEKGKDRKRSRRGRSPSPHDHDYEAEDRHHRSSRSSRKDRDKDRDRDRDYERDHEPERERRRDRDRERETTTTKASLKPAEPSDLSISFSIKGRSRKIFQPTGTSTAMPPPSAPTGPSSTRREREREREPPKGPAADRSKDRRRNSGAAPGSPPAAKETAVVEVREVTDPHALEREARNRERMLREEQRRLSSSLSLSSSTSTDRKRKSFGGVGAEDAEKPFAPPTGPSAERAKRARVDGGAGGGRGRGR